MRTKQRIEAPGETARGVALGVFAAVAFGTVAIFAKLGYRAEAEPGALLTARFALAAGLLMTYRALRRLPRIPPARAGKLMLLGGIGYAAESSLFFAALEHAPAGIVGLVFFSFPLWTTVLALALGLERLRVRLLVALALGTIGVGLIFAAPGGGLTGPLLALGAAVAVAIFLIVVQLVVGDAHSSATAAWTATGAALSIGVGTLVTGQSLPAEALPYGAALGIATAIAFLALYAAIGLIGSSRVAIANMFEPVVTVFLAAVVLGEAITPRLVAGTVLVISALPVLARSGAKPPAAP